MSLRTCAADKCSKRFEPYLADQLYCSDRCGARMRMRLWRERQRGGGDGGGGGKQRRLFPKPVLVKPAEPKKVPQPTLFEGEGEVHATYAGSVEYAQDGSQRPIRNVSGITLNRAQRKPQSRVQRAVSGGGQHAA